MDFHLTNEQQMLRKMYREFAENEVKPLAEEIDEEERFPMETVEKMAKLGLMGIYFPKQYGGAGGDVLSYAMCVEELAKVCGTTAVFEEEELLEGEPKCPNCGKPLDFEVTEE